VLSPAHQVSANHQRAAGFHFLAQPRLEGDDEEHALDIEPDSAWSVGAVAGPPLREALDLTPRAGLDALGQRQG
jgi:hypothetical protein